ncbi:hypothetical protein HK098_004006 [Nowakowskiella sp. JEL0407]|nr:hypothetical protein HK098_004006 [Nowakowskiella sp. JEL0407]
MNQKQNNYNKLHKSNSNAISSKIISTLNNLSRPRNTLRLLTLLLICFYALPQLYYKFFAPKRTYYKVKYDTRINYSESPESPDVVAALLPDGSWTRIKSSQSQTDTDFAIGEKLWLNQEDFNSPNVETGGKDWMKQISPLNLNKPYFNEGVKEKYDRTFFKFQQTTYEYLKGLVTKKVSIERWKRKELWADDYERDNWVPLRESNKGRRELQFRLLFAAWSEFADGNRVPYWLAESSLLGWWWGQEILPWHESIQVQIPAKTLVHLWKRNGIKFTRNRFGLRVFNLLGRNRYVLDVSPFIHYRHIQPRNTVDARFIDTHTGLFIDITAYSSVPWIRGQLETKKSLKATVQQIQPLRRSTFEGSPTWIPASSESILELEFGHLAIFRMFFGKYRFDTDLMKWVELDCTALFEVYVKGAGSLIHRNIKVDWAHNRTHCIVELFDKNKGEKKQMKNDKEVIMTKWVKGRKKYTNPLLYQ